MQINQSSSLVVNLTRSNFAVHHALAALFHHCNRRRKRRLDVETSDRIRFPLTIHPSHSLSLSLPSRVAKADAAIVSSSLSLSLPLSPSCMTGDSKTALSYTHTRSVVIGIPNEMHTTRTNRSPKQGREGPTPILISVFALMLI